MTDGLSAAECAALRLLLRSGYRTDVLAWTAAVDRKSIRNHGLGDCAHDLRIGPWDGQADGDPERADAAVTR